MGEHKSTCSSSCFYCDGPLGSHHEHDHAPIPRRNGGTTTFCVCVGCHDLKDRTMLADLNGLATHAMSMFWKAQAPMERIVFMKMVSLVSDALATTGDKPEV